MPPPHMQQTPAAATPFLSGGETMGKLMRDRDWASTSLGTPSLWPLSLKTALHILLNAATPSLLFWGPDSACFYNDAFLSILPGSSQAPHLPGKPGRELWAEGWYHIKPLLDRTLSGEIVEGQKLLLPVLQNGHPTSPA